ncbi:MAG: hypothetical protein WCJ37_03510 [Syntrophus sp. (in: bacteria)]
MRGIWYDPQVHNQGGALMKGIMQGAELGMRAVKLYEGAQLADAQLEKSGLEQKSMEIDLDRKTRIQKAEEEIGTLSTQFQDETKKLREGIKQPSMTQGPSLNPEIQRMMGW